MITLDSIKWRSLNDAYGSAAKIPGLLKQLSDFPAGEGYEEEPWFSLWSALCHQGDVYSASFAAVPHIVNVIEQSPSRASFNYFLLPAAIEVARVDAEIEVPSQLASEYFEALSKLPLLAAQLARPDCESTLCRALLASIAVATGQHAIAKLLLEVEPTDIPDVLEWYFER